MPAMKSDFGADRIWWVDVSLPLKLQALRRRIATRLALGSAA